MNIVSDMWARQSTGDSASGRTGIMDSLKDQGTSRTAEALAGVSTTLGIMAKINEGNRKGGQYYDRAVDEQIAAAGAQAGAVQQTGELKSQLLAALGATTSQAGASGIDSGSGIAADTANTLTRRNVSAQVQTGISGDMKARQHQINSLRLIMAGKDAKRAGMLGGIGMGLDFAAKAAQMG